MKTTVWTLTTCLPDEGKPLVVGVFSSERDALSAFDSEMRIEWLGNGPEDDDAGHKLPYPGDPHEAHRAISEDRETIEVDAAAEKWGRYSLDRHEIEMPDPTGESA